MLRSIFSTRAVVIVTCVLGYLFAIQGTNAILGEQIDFLMVLVGILIATALSITLSAFFSFDIESKRAFVTDILLDVVFLAGAVVLLTYLTTVHLWVPGRTVDAEAIVLASTGVGLAVLDFLVSLNAGAGKLLEMDREHVSRGGT